MAKVWTSDRLATLDQASLQTLYRNAQNAKSPEAASIVAVIEEHGLLVKYTTNKSTRKPTAGRTLTKPWSPYRQVVIETYEGASRGKRSNVRARPIKGEFYPQSLNVECSTDMRRRFPVGTKFRVYAKESTSKDGQPFLYTHFSWPADVVSD